MIRPRSKNMATGIYFELEAGFTPTYSASLQQQLYVVRICPSHQAITRYSNCLRALSLCLSLVSLCVPLQKRHRCTAGKQVGPTVGQSSNESVTKQYWTCRRLSTSKLTALVRLTHNVYCHVRVKFSGGDLTMRGKHSSRLPLKYQR